MTDAVVYHEAKYRFILQLQKKALETPQEVVREQIEKVRVQKPVKVKKVKTARVKTEKVSGRNVWVLYKTLNTRASAVFSM